MPNVRALIQKVSESAENSINYVLDSKIYTNTRDYIQDSEIITNFGHYAQNPYCTFVGTAGDVAKIGSVVTHYYGFSLIYNKLFAAGGFLLYKLPYAESVSGILNSFPLIKFSTHLLGEINKSKYIPAPLGFTKSFSGVIGIMFPLYAIATNYEQVFSDAKSMATAFEHTVEQSLNFNNICGKDPEGILDYFFS